MASNGFFWLLLKRLPTILAVVLAPLTLFLVLHFSPGIREHFFPTPPPAEETALPVHPDPEPFPTKFKGPAAEEKTERPPVERKETVPPPMPLDWEAEASACTTAESYLDLARKAKDEDRPGLARWFYLEALRLDPENAAAHTALGDVRFDPATHLVDFDRIEGQQMEARLRPFRRLDEGWMLPGDLEAIRTQWGPVRDVLLQELEDRAADPHDDLRRILIRRLVSKGGAWDKVIRETGYWIDRSHRHFRIFMEGEKDGTSKLFAMALRRHLESQLGDASVETPFMVWVRTTGKTFRAELDREEGMLVIYRPPDFKDYRATNPAVEPAARAFRAMIGKREVIVPQANAPPDPSTVLLTREEILRLVGPDLPDSERRSIILHLVIGYGCRPAWQDIEPLLGTEDHGLEREYLEKAALFEEELYRKLAKRKIAFFHDGRSTTLTGIDGEELLCNEARLPWSAISVDFLIKTAKKELGATSEEDRFGYCLFYLFRRDRERLMRELRYLEDDIRKREIESMLGLYTKAWPGALLLNTLSGFDEEIDLDQLKKRVKRLRDSRLISAQRDAVERSLRGLLLEKRIEEYLEEMFPGYQGTDRETGKSLFTHAFEADEELDAFTLTDVTHLQSREEKIPNSRAFRIKNGFLDGYGTAWAVFEPVFTGDMTITMEFKISNPKGRAASLPVFYLGYGLDSDLGFVASLAGCHLLFQEPGSEKIRREDCTDLPDSMRERGDHALHLQGSDQGIENRLNGTTTLKSVEKGFRKGRIFLGVDMEAYLQVNRLRVEAGVDPLWLQSAVNPRVAAEISEILD